MLNSAHDVRSQTFISNSTPLKRIAAMVLLDLITIRTMSIVAAAMIGISAVATMAIPLESTMPFMTMISIIMIVNLYNIIDSSDLHFLYGSLPVLPREVVAAHYLVGILSIAASASPLILGACIGGGSRSDLMNALCAGVGSIFVLLALLLPVYTAWGAQRGGIVFLFSVFLIGIFGFYGPSLPFDAPSINFKELFQVIPLYLLAFSLLVYFISYLISARIYARADH
ncbi:hypothetical protein KEM60_02404 [Austwickia sp. TVS 96-490-7B]|uniref:ABC-2 transporter permease n=1 Tax=Austwickia sp. TVS 96-490-7B TaxID=2830843 RepID=UPI001C56CEEA|nr:ABC-2 transporter permease [Austwickia sp. TVS 96-490-7B]MBW3086193.1 hypothetical protein [Austwickia sp. TVS 96-490-7B]